MLSDDFISFRGWCKFFHHQICRHIAVLFKYLPEEINIYVVLLDIKDMALCLLLLSKIDNLAQVEGHHNPD